MFDRIDSVMVVDACVHAIYVMLDIHFFFQIHAGFGRKVRDYDAIKTAIFQNFMNRLFI